MDSMNPDLALALILQAKYNKEAKGQEDKKEENALVAINNLAKPTLVDPEWELTDPTPDIHGLFIAFNDRFFWSRLIGVEVKWSHQMTSCAGICVYEGRNGLCSVRLSAPLLKLRPRSDLIETLLHEMIHAYLFVTNNNRDRDGHGPEFHRHMNRINKEAGTNITVYHSFHSEVKLYQQHWWRCDGPCQHRPPFFGMVKRAKNRVPGPNDLWWAEHQASCGGNFIKVREPAGYKRKNVKPKEGKDIRDFFRKPVASRENVSSSGVVGSNVFGLKNLTSSSNSSETGINPKLDATNNVVGFKDLSKNGHVASKGTPPQMPVSGGYVLGGRKSESLSSNTSRLLGCISPSAPTVQNNDSANTSRDSSAFKNTPVTTLKSGGNVLGGRTGERKNNNQPKSRYSSGTGGILANRGGGTLVITGSKAQNKNNENSLNEKTETDPSKTKLFSGTGFTLGGTTSAEEGRSRLLNLGSEPNMKKKKLDSNSASVSSYVDLTESDDICSCSACNKMIPRLEMDDHLEHCEGLENIFNDSEIESELIDENEINDINKRTMITSCPVCSKDIKGEINAHLDKCLEESGVCNLLDEPPIVISDDDDKAKSNKDPEIEIIGSEDRVPCFICGLRFGESRINDHVNQCIDGELSDL